LITATGLVCLRSAGLAGHPGRTRITIGGIADRSGHLIWLRSPRAAERTLSELFRTHGMRRGAGLVIEAAPHETDQLLRASAQLIGVEILETAQVDTLTTTLAKRCDTAIAGMGRKATLKRCRRAAEYDLSGLLDRL
jgi:hypothetical protein